MSSEYFVASRSDTATDDAAALVPSSRIGAAFRIAREPRDLAREELARTKARSRIPCSSAPPRTHPGTGRGS